MALAWPEWVAAVSKEYHAIISRRSALAAALLSGLVPAAAQAADKQVKIGINLSFTGALAESAARNANGAVLALEEANEAGTVPGYAFVLEKFDDATATAGQYDPAQAAINARKMVSDRGFVVALGPQSSGAGKAMAPILSQGGLATITPSSTNPDISDPKFASQYRPAGKPIYFRTVATDAYQGPNMANFMAERLGVKSVFVLDDSGAYGVGIADTFQRQAEKKGIAVLGRDRLDPKAADYSAILTRIKSLAPTAIYFGGDPQAGVKLAKQSYEIVPGIIKAGGDGMQSADLLKGAGFPAVEGWHTTVAAPHVTVDPKTADFTKRYRARFGFAPDDYTITTYTAAGVAIDAVRRVVAAGKPVTRDTVRDAVEATKLPDSLLGPISFDTNGDLTNKVISVFRITRDDSKPLDEPYAQYRYIGVAPSD